MTIDKLHLTRLNFFVNADNKLVAVLASGPPLEELTVRHINEMLDAAGFGQAFIYDRLIAELLEFCHSKLEQQVFVHIGEIRDFSFTISFSNDRMEAYLAVEQPYGGAAPNAELIWKAIQEKGIIHGIVPEEVEKSIQAMDGRERTIARGEKPQPGKNAVFTSLLPDKKIPEAVVETDQWRGVEDSDFSDLLSVEAGMPVMQRTPATAGIGGCNVLGKEVPAKQGEDIHFTPGLKGVEVDQLNSNLLIAKVSGQPIRVPYGIYIEPLLTLENVDLSTGNINFSGSLQIRGNVTAGMKVRAKNDIFIGGVVESAEIQAEGSITVAGGIIGRGEKEKGKNSGKWIAFLRCDGRAAVRFAENAHIESGESILVQDSSLNSTLICSEKLVIGSQRSSKGLLAGGSCHAGLRIETRVLGIVTEVQTDVLVGIDPTAYAKGEALREAIRAKTMEKMETQKTLLHYKRLEPAKYLEKVHELEMLLEKIQAEIQQLAQDMKQHKSRLEGFEKARIIVRDRIYPGVNIQIGSKKMRTNEATRGGTFYLLDDEITFTSRILN